MCSTMDTFSLTVVRRGNRFVAKSTSPVLTALGSTSEKAAENARRMAIELLAPDSRPATMIVRITQPGLSTITMQPLASVFTVDRVGEKVGWRYTASVASPDRVVGN
jgi:hypothetical protein